MKKQTAPLVVLVIRHDPVLHEQIIPNHLTLMALLAGLCSGVFTSCHVTSLAADSLTVLFER